MTHSDWKSKITRTNFAWFMLGWSALSLILVLAQAPMALRLPIVGPYAALAVGCAVVVVMRIKMVALAIGLAIAIGISALNLISLFYLYAFGSSPLLAFTTEVAIVTAAAAWIIFYDRVPGELEAEPESAPSEVSKETSA
jgi:hypothetical protein